MANLWQARKGFSHKISEQQMKLPFGNLPASTFCHRILLTFYSRTIDTLIALFDISC